ncbi:MAG: ABC transporter permease [Clostridia bacterium]|nr:ABC transporter permease [Clostridia bacterium]
MKNELRALFSREGRPRLNGSYLLSLAISVFLALLVGAGIMLATGHDPLAGYAAIVSGAVGSRSAIGSTLAKTATLCLTGLATAVGAQAGIFNVGGEGQLYFGAIASALVGAALTGASAFIAVPLCLLAAVAAGGLWAWIPGWLKVKLKVNEVITTIMMNSIAIYFCKFLSSGPFKTAERGHAKGTAKIASEFLFSKLISPNLTTSIFLSAGIALFVWYLMKRSVTGYEMKLTGENPRFARYMGIRSDRLMLLGMVISGAICGLVGMFEVFGLHKRFIDTVSNEFYYDGMLVAMIMRYNPTGIILMSFFFGAMKIGGTGMEKIGIPSETILVVQSIIIFFMAAEHGISESFRAWRIRRAAQKRIEESVKGGGEHA